MVFVPISYLAVNDYSPGALQIEQYLSGIKEKLPEVFGLPYIS